MDARSIGTILLRVAGLVLIVFCVAQVPAYFALMTRGANWTLAETLGAAALALGPLAILGVGLWLFPGTVVNKIVSGPPVSDSAFDSRPIELVALTVLGLYLVAMGLVDFVHDIVYLIAIRNQSPDATLIPASIIGRIAASVAQFAIGAWLCIGSRGVSRIIEKARGREHES